MFFKIFIPFLGLIINFLIQILSYRYILKSKLMESVYWGFLSGVLIVIIVGRDALMVNLALYFTLSYIYFHFLNLGETSRRIRLLRELNENKNGLSLDELLVRYNGQEVLENRMRRLINNGQVILRQDRYYIGKPYMILIARILSILRLILFGVDK